MEQEEIFLRPVPTPVSHPASSGGSVCFQAGLCLYLQHRTQPGSARGVAPMWQQLRAQGDALVCFWWLQAHTNTLQQLPFCSCSVPSPASSTPAHWGSAQRLASLWDLGICMCTATGVILNLFLGSPHMKMLSHAPPISFFS